MTIDCMPEKRGYDRRKALKVIGVGGLTGTAIPGITTAKGKATGKSTELAEVTVTTDDLDTESVTTSTSDVTTQSTGIDTENVTHVASFNSTLNLESPAGVNYGEAEGHATMYRALDQVDDEYVYFIWHHMTAYPDHGYFYNVQIREMKVEIDVVDNDVTLLTYDPDSSQVQREREYNIGIDVTLPSGAGAGLSGTNYVNQGTIHPRNQETGQGGSYAVQYENNSTSENSISMNAISEYRSDELFTDDLPWRGDYFDVELYAAADGNGE